MSSINPLSPNLSAMTNEELNERINNLTKRLRQSGQNPRLISQLNAMLTECFTEQKERAEKQKSDLDDDLAKLIDI